MTMPGEIRLSLCMIVRNERAVLERCLTSVRGLADELILVDTGSTDGTVELARALGAQVRQIPWPGDFSVARNVALADASGAWILVLDADEWLQPAAVADVRELVQRPPTAAFELIQRNIDAAGHEIPNAIVRLFPRRPDVRFSYPIHEEVNASLVRCGVPIRATAIRIEHSGYVDAACTAAKLQRNRAILEAAIARGATGGEAQHLHFYLGASWRDDGRWLDAAREFEWCRGHSTPGSRLARIAQLRAAECYVRAGETERARRLLPAIPDPNEHPAALLLVGDMLAHTAPTEARGWYEALLGVPDIVHQPPVALAPLKSRALQWLAADWGERQGRKDIGVKLLRMVLEIHRHLRDGGVAELQADYDRAVRGEPGR